MPDELDITNINVGLPSTVVQRFKLPQQTIDYLWERIDIAKKNPICHKKHLAGKISHSYLLEDPQNVVIQNVNNILFNPIDNPKMFEFINMEVANMYRKSVFDSSFLRSNKAYSFISTFNPKLESIWVNFQKKGEFQPIHSHGGMFSFVIWMDIPYHYKDEAKLPFARSNSHFQCGSFAFAFSDPASRSVLESSIELSPKMNGYCCFFPSDLCHQVYPFYTSDKDRISISGNITHQC